MKTIILRKWNNYPEFALTYVFISKNDYVKLISQKGRLQMVSILVIC